MKRRALFALAPLALAGCSSFLPDKPVREVQYDFGPLPPPGSTATAAGGTPLVLPDVEVNDALESTSMLYRLGYSDPHQLRPYAYARWSAPPGQLLRQRLRERLGRDRPILDATAAASLARRGGAVPPTLRVELEEFSQLFDTQTTSLGIVRVRCTLLESTTAGERLVAQRAFVQQSPAASADAAGGVRALTAATDAVAQDVASWLRGPR